MKIRNAEMGDWLSPSAPLAPDTYYEACIRLVHPMAPHLSPMRRQYRSKRRARSGRGRA